MKAINFNFVAWGSQVLQYQHYCYSCLQLHSAFLRTGIRYMRSIISSNFRTTNTWTERVPTFMPIRDFIMPNALKTTSWLPWLISFWVGTTRIIPAFKRRTIIFISRWQRTKRPEKRRVLRTLMVTSGILISTWTSTRKVWITSFFPLMPIRLFWIRRRLARKQGRMHKSGGPMPCITLVPFIPISGCTRKHSNMNTRV